MINPDTDVAGVTRSFHELFYNDFERTWEQTYWLGTKVLKCPLDLWIYQELLHRVKPDLVIECGTAHGGSALYLASIMDLLDRGKVLTVDIEGPATFPNRPRHRRITYLHGSSIEPMTVIKMKKAAARGVVMVILDSDHRQQHVAAELDIYSELVSPGSYLIVEDTNVNGHPICPEHGPGPMEALESWLQDHPDFVIDPDCEKFHLTFNPKGYLRRED